MTLSADDWHIIAIFVFPLISFTGITASVFISAANNRTILAMGVMFSAGVLLSASLVHMLPHATEVLDIHFAGEDSHDSHDDPVVDSHLYDDDHFDLFGHSAHDDDHADLVDDHSDHDHRRRLMMCNRLLQDDHDGHDHGSEGGSDAHAGHNHAFPWAQTIFSIAFIVLLCIEATMERFIDVYFAGKKGNFFHIEEDEELMYAQGFAADLEREKREREEIMNQTTKEPKEEATTSKNECLHDYGEGPCPSSGHSHHHDHGHASSDHHHGKAEYTSVATEENAEKGEKSSEAPKMQDEEKPILPAQNSSIKEDDKITDISADTEAASSNEEGAVPSKDDDVEPLKEDTQPPRPPGSTVNIQMYYPDCKDCQLSVSAPQPDCKECMLTAEELGYGDPDLQQRHHHHNNLHRRNTGSAKSDTASSLPGHMFANRMQRRNSGASNVSGKSSVWAKTAGRPSVVSFGVTPPMDEPDVQQTINPWVSILLTLVLSIHVILEGLTIGSSQDVESIKKTFVAIAVHKVFAAFSLGNSLIASGYWESSRTMFFVLAFTFISVDIVSLGIGMALSDLFDQNANVAGGILQSLLGGSFMFVASIELIPGELEKMRRHGLPLLPILMCLCLGFALMTLLTKWGV